MRKGRDAQGDYLSKAPLQIENEPRTALLLALDRCKASKIRSLQSRLLGNLTSAPKRTGTDSVEKQILRSAQDHKSLKGSIESVWHILMYMPDKRRLKCSGQPRYL
jgi:hypothetical protein